MKKLILTMLLLVLTASLIIAGCAQPAPAPSPSPSPAPAPTPAAPKVIELSFAHHEPPVSPSAKIYQEWADKIGAQTQGRVKITVYPAEGLAKLRDVWASVTGGVADIGLTVLAEEGKHLQLSNVMKQSSALVPDGLPALKIWDELWNKFPEIQAEYKDVKMLFYFVTSAPGIHTIDKQVRVPNDVKGMKIVCPPGGAEIEFMRLSGATPIAQPAPEWFTALERKMAEGLMAPNAAMQIFGTADLFKYHVYPSYGPNMLYTVMNMSKWNSLPPDIQKVFMDLTASTNEQLTNQKAGEDKQISERLKKEGRVFIDLKPEERNLWNAAVASAADKWIKDTEAVGKPAGKVYEETLKLSKKYTQ